MRARVLRLWRRRSCGSRHLLPADEETGWVDLLPQEAMLFVGGGWDLPDFLGHHGTERHLLHHLPGVETAQDGQQGHSFRLPVEPEERLGGDDAVRTGAGRTSRLLPRPRPGQVSGRGEKIDPGNETPPFVLDHDDGFPAVGRHLVPPPIAPRTNGRTDCGPTAPNSKSWMTSGT